MTLHVAIAGRPNVGKSTLFNKLVGKKMSIVDNTPGVTRDYRMAGARVGQLRFVAIDTAGLEEGTSQSISGRMRYQTDQALDLADVVLFMIDGRDGVTEADRHFAEILRRQSLPIILCVNKCEGQKGQEGLYTAFELGFGNPIEMSAEHNIGMSDLEEALNQYVVDDTVDGVEEDEVDNWNKNNESNDDIEEDNRPIHLAIVGRPNVGKSTLLNALVGEDRAMTGAEPGITRDAIAVPWEFEEQKFRLVDTAGMRKKAKIDDKLEKMSLDDTFRAIRLAHVVILVLDGNAILDKQDLAIARMITNEGRALIVCVNKWDAVEDKQEALLVLKERLHKSMPQVKDVPFVTISALYEKNLPRLMRAVKNIYDIWNRRVSTGKLNRWLEGMVAAHPPPLVSGRPNTLKYMTQAKARPPTFAVFASKPNDIADSYKRYLVNALREDFDMPGVPIRIAFKTSKNPYVD